ncbi:AAA family ATPase [Chitinophaga sedimenti]|uniref:AAA domain-containing protein n=1 Tax=Chitinophaga sedimenti TaxID=2033606 RepID=UPI0020034B4B|nr:AAA domain-containing protein [Chitinophaga sedimenti]MCK7556370.1 AAA family ATPase [Chitinophaga sedimenti]
MKAFGDLGYADDYNLKEELSENIQFIFGPPGTGKTTELSKRILEKIRSDNSKYILVLTPTNTAADVLVNSILNMCNRQDYPDSWLVRFGASTDMNLVDMELVYDGNLLKFHLYNKCVVVTTVQRFPYEK